MPRLVGKTQRDGRINTQERVSEPTLSGATRMSKLLEDSSFAWFYVIGGIVALSFGIEWWAAMGFIWAFIAIMDGNGKFSKYGHR
jgi:hypothetical protein